MLEKGQSLLELILAMGIFVTVIAGLSFFVLDSYITGRLSYEISKADFLAQEGLEAARSIRDNNFNDLVAGSHGLTITLGRWTFQGTQEDVSSQLTQGIRQIQIENIDSDTRRVTSSVAWLFSEGRNQEVELVSYLTNWQKTSGVEIRKPTVHNDPSPRRTTNAGNAYDYPDGTTFATTNYGVNKNPSITFYNWQLPTQAYNSLVLNYRYHAGQAANDRYAIAYSTTGCAGTFTNLISPTSSGAPDTTVSVILDASQNLSLLCLKIYSTRTGSSDNANLYTRDIWTEGSF